MAHKQRVLEGETLGSFKVLTELGRGGMAVVYKGVQESLNRPVAIKVLPSEFSGTAELKRRFYREAEALAVSSHPNIIQVIERGEVDGVCYFAMEYVEGGSLKDVMTSSDLTYDRILDIALQICAGLEHAHALGIVHRDLKPANVLCDRRTGRVKIADFGIAQFARGPESATLTSSHVAMGTLNYMSPEQKVDAKNVDHRTDIYALGVMLYEMLTGHLPMGSFDPPSSVNKRVPREADAVVLRALKTAPQQRHESVAELAEELRRLRADAGRVGVLRVASRVANALTEAANSTIGTRAGRAGLVLALAGVVAIGVFYYRSPDGPRPDPPADPKLATSTSTSTNGTVETVAGPSAPTALAEAPRRSGLGAAMRGARPGTRETAPEPAPVEPAPVAAPEIDRAAREREIEAVETAWTDMVRAQKRADAAKAKDVAADTYADASAARAAGEAHRDAGRNAQAAIAFERARQAYGEAAGRAESAAAAAERRVEADRAARALAAAQRETEDLRRAVAAERERAAEARAPENAGGLFTRAAEEERAANELAAAGQHAAARTRFETARALYAEAGRAARDVASRPPPPPPPPAGPSTPPPAGPAGGTPGGAQPPPQPPTQPPTQPPPAPAAAAVSEIRFAGAYVPAGRGAGTATYPKGLAADAAGAFYFGDLERGTVARLGPQGAVGWEVSGFARPYDVALSPDGGTLYVANTGGHSIVMLDAETGRRTGSFGTPGGGPGQFNAPYAVAVSRAGEVFVYDRLNKRVQRLDGTGKFLGQFPATGAGNFAGLAVDAQGRVYVTEGEGLRRWDPADGSLRPFASHLNPINATGIAVDAQDRVYVSDTRQPRVIVLTTKGDRLREVRNGGDGELRTPLNVAAGGGRLHVLDLKGSRKVHVFEVR